MFACFLCRPDNEPLSREKPADTMSARHNHHDTGTDQDHGTINSISPTSQPYILRRSRQTLSIEVRRGRLLEHIGGFHAVERARPGANGTNGPCTRLRPSKPRPPTVGPPAALPQLRPLKCGVIGWQSLPCSGAPNHWLPCFTTTPNSRQAMTHKGFGISRPLDAMCLEKGLERRSFSIWPACYGRMASAKQASLANNQDTEPRALSWQAGNQDLFLFYPCPAPAWKPSVLQEDYSISSPSNTISENTDSFGFYTL